MGLPHPPRLEGASLLVSVVLSQEAPASMSARAGALMASLGERVCAEGGVLVVGGHPAVTPPLHRLVAEGVIPAASVRLFVLRHFDGAPPLEAHDASVFVDRTVIGGGTAPGTPGFERDLAALREAMAQASNAALFVGGQTEGSLGREPGLSAEWRAFRSHNPGGPAFVAGLLGGLAASVLGPEVQSGRRSDETQLTDLQRAGLLRESEPTRVVEIVSGQLELLRPGLRPVGAERP